MAADLRKRKARDESFQREVYLALSIPSVLLAGPLVGLILGYGATRLLHLSPEAGRLALLFGLILGLATAAREVIRIVRRISKAADRTSRRVTRPEPDAER